MKIRSYRVSHRPVARCRSRFTPFAVMAVFAVAAIASPFVFSNNFARADSYDNQINANNQEISNQNNIANQALAQEGSYNDAINTLQSQIDTLNNKIAQNKQKIADLTNQIAAAEQQITQQSQAVVNALKNMYYDKQSSSTLNIIMNSNSVSDYVNAQARQTTIQNNLQKSIDKINELKQQLANQKAQVQSALNDQTAQQNQQVATKGAKQQLLDQSKGSQTAAATKITSLQNNNTQLKQKQKETNAAALAAAVQKAAAQNPTQPVAGSNPDPGAGSARQVSHSPAIGISQNSQCGGGYPYCGSAQDSMVDPWGLYNRECVSYTAYKVYSTYGYMPYMGGNGNAAQWPGHLAGRVPEGSTPKVGSVAIMNIGYYGHAAWVEAVNGGWVTVSQYNWDEAGHYSTMTVPASLFSVYIYF